MKHLELSTLTKKCIWFLHKLGIIHINWHFSGNVENMIITHMYWMFYEVHELWYTNFDALLLQMQVCAFGYWQYRKCLWYKCLRLIDFNPKLQVRKIFGVQWNLSIVHMLYSGQLLIAETIHKNRWNHSHSLMEKILYSGQV